MQNKLSVQLLFRPILSMKEYMAVKSLVHFCQNQEGWHLHSSERTGGFVIWESHTYWSTSCSCLLFLFI